MQCAAQKEQHPPGEEVRRVSLLVAVGWEEVASGRLRQVLGGGRAWRNSNSLDRLAGDEGDVAACNAEVAQFAVRKAAQLGDRVTVTAPVAIIADQVHFIHRSSSTELVFFTSFDGLKIDAR